MYERIPIVVDDTPFSEWAVRDGTALAAVHGAEAVCLGLPADYPAPPADTVAERHGMLAHKNGARARGSARTVVDTASLRRCDPIVVAADDHNAVVRLLNGHLVPALITASPLPVLICKSRDGDAKGPKWRP